jgi:hypothetical protein
MKSLKFGCLWAVALSLAIGCAVEKSENPLTPTIAGPIPGVEISAPKPLEPSSNAQIPGDRQPLSLLIENSWSTGPRPLSYLFEVASDPNFSSRVFAKENVPAGEEGRTTLQLPDVIPMGRVYYWRAKAQDGANEGPYSTPVHFNLFTPLAFDQPTPISPINNVRLSTLRPEFKFRNAPFVGTPTSVGYVIELATRDTFANRLSVWQFSEGDDDITVLDSPTELPAGLQLFWRVRAIEGSVLGPWSTTHVFRTPEPVAPEPAPTPGPSGPRCDGTSNPLTIVQCQRARYPTPMSASQTVAFLRGVARDLNAAGVPEGPFGILRKTSGANCGGYSCDIICSGNGSGQKQWDVLIAGDPGIGDAVPMWRRLDNIAERQCDVVR